MRRYSSTPIRSSPALDGPDQHGKPFPSRGGLDGEPVYLYMYNDTISNSSQGVHINSDNGRRYQREQRLPGHLSTTRSTTTRTPIQTIAPAPQFNGTTASAASKCSR